MNNFFDISNINWWIGVVFVGIIINIVSARISPMVDKSLGRLSSTYKAYVDARKQRREDDILRLVTDPNSYAVVFINLLAYRTVIFFYQLLIPLVFIFASLVISVDGLVIGMLQRAGIQASTTANLLVTGMPITFMLMSAIMILSTINAYRRVISDFAEATKRRTDLTTQTDEQSGLDSANK